MITFVAFHAERPQSDKTKPLSPDYFMMADWMFRSATLFHPDCRKILLTDRWTDCSSLPSDVQILRDEVDINALMYSRTLAQLNFLKGHDFTSDVVFLDTDMLIQANLAVLFEKDFDLAFTYTNRSVMKINGGLIFVSRRNRKITIGFFEQLKRIYEAKFADRKAWEGDQYALDEATGAQGLVTDGDVCWEREGAKLLFLPCDRYNYPPRRLPLPWFQELAEKRVIHFKGTRKVHMGFYYQMRLAIREGRNVLEFLNTYRPWDNVSGGAGGLPSLDAWLTVAIVHKDRPEKSFKAVASVYKRPYDRLLEILIIDKSGREDFERLLVASYPEVRLLRVDPEASWGECLSLAVRNAHAPWILFSGDGFRWMNFNPTRLEDAMQKSGYAAWLDFKESDFLIFKQTFFEVIPAGKLMSPQTDLKDLKNFFQKKDWMVGDLSGVRLKKPVGGC